ncbi:MAG: uridine kinase [Armatimonadota bacterium]
MKKLAIGVAGGTGSGKTTVAKNIYNALKGEKVLAVNQDSYYKDQAHLSMEERKKINYDHPFAFDNDLLIEQLKELFSGKDVSQPEYCFTTYTRTENTKILKPKEIYIIEGILLLEDKRIRELLDIKLFVDTDADVRFIRRLKRDVKERGRTLDNVVDQYMGTVRPMHLQFVEPTKRYADVIIPEGGLNKVAIDLVVARIKSLLAGIH